MARRQARAGDVVDADRRDRVVVEAELERDERQLALARQFDKARTAFDAEQDETVDKGALDVPGKFLLVAGRYKRDSSAGGVACLGNAGHHGAGKGIVEEIGERLGRGDADRVDLAGTQQAALWIRPGIAQRLGGCLDPFADFLAHDFGTAEDVGGGAVRDAGGLGDIGQPDRSCAAFCG